MSRGINRILFMAALLAYSGTAVSKEYSLVMPTNTTLGRGELASMMSAIKTILKVYKKQTGTDIILKPIIEDKAYNAIIENEQSDFVQAAFVQPERMIRNGYKSFVTIQAYGEPQPKSCIYVPKSSPAKDWRGLKNKNILIPRSNLAYFAMRKMLNQPPEGFFKKVSFKKDDSSSIYALAFGQVDAVVVKHAMVKFFGFTNPGPVKKIKALNCFQDGTWFTLAYHKRVPQAEITRLLKFVTTINQNAHPDLGPIKILLNRLQLKFIPQSHENYMKTSRWLTQMLAQGKARKWHLELSRLKKLGKAY